MKFLTEKQTEFLIQINDDYEIANTLQHKINTPYSHVRTIRDRFIKIGILELCNDNNGRTSSFKLTDKGKKVKSLILELVKYISE